MRNDEIKEGGIKRGPSAILLKWNLIKDDDNDCDEVETKKKILLIVTIITEVITITRDPLRTLRINGSRASRRYLIVTNTNNGVIGIACAH